MQLMPHQIEALDLTESHKRCAYFLDMGLGKTYVGGEKLIRLGNPFNLVVCQKSKIDDWMEHFRTHYTEFGKVAVYDLTNKKDFDLFIEKVNYKSRPYWGFDCIGVINYELAWRRKELLNLKDFTLMLDESSLIQNEKSKQAKFILNLNPSACVLLSGTPVSGKYENLWSQAQLLGWKLKRDVFDNTYINWTLTEDDGSGMRHRVVDKVNPYKNIERLRNKLRVYGSVFMKTEDVLTLPEQRFITVRVKAPKDYWNFLETGYHVFPDGSELIGATVLTKRLYAKQLVNQYNPDKLEALKDLIQSTNDRLIVFYCFNAELDALKTICDELNRPYSEVNGEIKDLTNYERCEDAVTLVQYQAGAMGLNLQKCNKTIYFSLPDRSDLYEQSKKRTHRIGQKTSCVYYVLLANGTIDERIYETLQMRKDYTDELFVEDINR